MKYIAHYGTKFHSGRYPYGSGDRPNQHSGPKSSKSSNSSNKKSSKSSSKKTQNKTQDKAAKNYTKNMSSTLSNKDLQNAINRINLEKDYNYALQNYNKTIEKDKSALSKIISSVGNAVSNGILQGLNIYISNATNYFLSEKTKVPYKR